MSRLSQLFHRMVGGGSTGIGGVEGNIIKGVVEHLETLDIPGPQRKTVALAMLKALHIELGEKWDDELANAVSGAIEYALADIRKYATDYFDNHYGGNTPTPSPKPAYGLSMPNPIPSDVELISRGFSVGDVVWEQPTVLRWLVTLAGGLPGGGYEIVRPIGGAAI